MVKKVPYIEINQQTECGIGCICMLLRFYKHYVTLTELRERLEVGRDGNSLRQLIKLMEEYNLSAKAYNIVSANLKSIPTPAILFWDNRHFVVLEKVNKNTYYIADPSLGYLKYTYDEFEKHYSNTTIIVKPNENFEKKAQAKVGWTFVNSVFLSEKSLYIKMVVASLFMYGTTLIIPILIQYIIDASASPQVSLNLAYLFMLLTLVSLFYLLVFRLRGKSVLNLRVKVDRKLNTEIFNHLLRLPFKYFELRGKGNIIYNINSTATIREIFTSQLVTGIIDCGATIFIGIYMIIKSPILFAIAFFLFLLNIIVLKISYRTLLQNSRDVLVEQSTSQSVQMESVYSILGIKMTSIENSIFNDWEQKFSKYISKFIKKENYNLSMNSWLSFLLFASPIIILCCGLILSKNGNITIGETIAFYTLSGNFYSLSHSVFNTWTGIINSKAIFERISDIILEKPENTNPEGVKCELKGDIKLENVSFRYTNNSGNVLKNINMHIPVGKKISIVGKSGDGKTTLAKLLVGLYRPSEGHIYYDDLEIDQWNLNALRNQIGIVPQDVSLFNKTIYENIVLDSNKEVSFEDVRSACQAAEILEEIETMPMGFNTIISEMGMNLSGGQRQRIMLARAILNKPQILILDEATSSLDNINQEKVSQNLSKLNCTQVIIAHRLSTIIDSDIVFVLEDGKIVEQGTHEELLTKGGTYYKLYTNFDKENL